MFKCHLTNLICLQRSGKTNNWFENELHIKIKYHDIVNLNYIFLALGLIDCLDLFIQKLSGSCSWLLKSWWKKYLDVLNGNNKTELTEKETENWLS